MCVIGPNGDPTDTLVAIPLNGVANPLLSYSSDIWRKRSAASDAL